MADVKKDPAQEDDGWGPDEEEIPNEKGDDGELTLTINTVEKVPEAGGDANVVVTVNVPESIAREPLDMCCVVDISGSMSQIASYEDEDGTMKDDGLSMLDIVKHAVKTVIKTLDGNDRLAVVAFDDVAETCYELGKMDAAGQDEAMVKVDNLQPRGRTNIWEGLLKGMEQLRKPPSAGELPKKKCLVLLTDGQPNIQPPKGHVPALRDYLESYPDFSFQLSTFGFGNQLDSDILLELAVEGRGTFAFIPDAKIVGTCFVNSIANSLTNMTQKAELHLMPKFGADFNGQVGGNLPVHEASWGRVVDLGILQYGQSRDVVVPLKIPGGDKAYLEAIVKYPRKQGTGLLKNEGLGKSRNADPGALSAFARSKAVEVTFQAVKDAQANRGQAANAIMKALVQDVEKWAAASFDGAPAAQEAAKALHSDVSGRIQKALSTKERFNRWGKHYLKALTRSHQVQLCSNFMDPGLQVYGGKLFKDLVTKGGQIFTSLPPPKPSRPQVVRTSVSSVGSSSGTGYAGGYRPAASQRAPSPNMATYYAGSGGG